MEVSLLWAPMAWHKIDLLQQCRLVGLTGELQCYYSNYFLKLSPATQRQAKIF